MEKIGGVYFKKVNSESVVQLVINSLTDAMVDRQLRPGDKLPTETELAESFGVGRNSIREAIKILVYLGVLEIRRPEGTFVCEGFHESMIDPMIYGIILDNSDDTYDNLIELREMIEVGVMQIAMGKYTPEELENLKAALLNLKEEIAKGIDNVDNVFEADNQFHMAISAMGENPLVDKINRVVRVLTHSVRYDTVKGMIASGRGEELYQAHEDLYKTMESRNLEHLNSMVRDTYFSDFDLGTNRK